jgi:hypothetical protein
MELFLNILCVIGFILIIVIISFIGDFYLLDPLLKHRSEYEVIKLLVENRLVEFNEKGEMILRNDLDNSLCGICTEHRKKEKNINCVTCQHNPIFRGSALSEVNQISQKKDAVVINKLIKKIHEINIRNINELKGNEVLKNDHN